MRRRTTAAAGVLITAALSLGFTGTADAADPASQVSTRPVGAVAAGDGSSTDQGSALPYVLGGVSLAAAGGAAVAARRSSRATA